MEIAFNAFVLPGPGRKLSSVPASLKQVLITINASVQPRLKVGNTVVPLQKTSEDVALDIFLLSSLARAISRIWP